MAAAPIAIAAFGTSQLLQHVTIIVTFVSGFTSAGVAAGSLAAAFQATIGHFTFFLFL